MRRVTIAVVCLSLSPVLILAQGPTAELTGTVSDSTGGAVIGATVSITNISTNAARVVKTNASGLYDAPSLLPGEYAIRLTNTGFQTVQTRVELQVGRIARQDFTLAIGNVTEAVEVNAQAPTLETESTALGTAVENKRIEELPLNGRNYLQLAALVPASTTYGPASSIAQQRGGGDRANFQLNIAGQRLENNHFTLDGVENTDPNYAIYLVQPSVDALQEFKVNTSTYTAEYGHNVGQISAITKSGTNEYHGALFEFLRNSALDAKNFFDSPKLPIVPFRRNQFGGLLGGPVEIPHVFNGRNKLFFFFNYEGLRQVKAQTALSSVPTANDRAGNFAGSSTTIYDPATRVLAADGTSVVSASPFPGNVIPASRINRDSTFSFQNFIPLPNNNPNGYVGNFLSNEGATANSDTETARVDYAQNANSNFMLRYSHGNEPQYSPQPLPLQGAVNSTISHQGVLGHTLVLGANKVNEFRFGVSRLEAYNGDLHSNNSQYDYVKQMGIPSVLDTPQFWGIPYVYLSNFASFGDPTIGNGPYAYWDTMIQWNDNFSWTKGTHSFKFGGEYMRTRMNLTGNDVARGRFTFSGIYTTPLPGVTPLPQNAVADFLLGTMSASEGQLGEVVSMLRSWYGGLYFQDQWRVTPKLTLTYGLRWELQPGFSEKYDHMALIDLKWDNSEVPTWIRLGTGDFYAGNPPFQLPANLPVSRDGRFGDTVFKNDWHKFAPRMGFAYSLTPKTVIRAGAGVYYVSEMGNAMFDETRNMPFSMRIATTANSLIPNETWTSPFPPGTTSVSSLGLNWQWGDPQSYVPQWTFTLQRQLTTNMSVEAAYVGSAGVHLLRTNLYNTVALGPPISNVNLRRPFPQFGGGIYDDEAASHSSYHSLQLRLQRRFSHGFSLLSSFTWHKSIDNGSGVRQALGDSYVPQDPNNLAGERGPSAFDYKYGWVTSALYELPIGRGKALFGTANKLIDAFVGGWQVGGIFNRNAGFPFSISCQSGVYTNGGGGCRADVTGLKPALSNPTPNDWFNLAAFTNRTSFVTGLGPYRYGTSGRNVVFGPGVTDLDFSVQKVFHPTDRANLEFRSEFFNLANHPIFYLPGSTVGTPTYGVITATNVPSRQIQFGLKLRF